MKSANPREGAFRTRPAGQEPVTPRNRPRLRVRLLGRLCAFLLRLQWLTWRKRIEGLEQVDAMLARGEGFLLVFWHGKYLPLFPFFQGRQACIFTSRSFRGEVLAEIGRRFGYGGVPIPEHAGEHGMDIMRRALARFPVVGIAVDGPLGPSHQVKSGAIRLAAESGVALVPASVASRRQKVLAKRWDRMEVPRLFTLVGLVCGEVVRVPSAMDETELNLWRRRLHDALEEVDRRAEKLVLDSHP